MEKSKEINLIRKRNTELTKQIDDLKFDMETDRKLNQKSADKAKSLIVEFETLQQEWQQLMEEMKAKHDEYQTLIEECKAARTEILHLKELFRTGGNH